MTVGACTLPVLGSTIVRALMSGAGSFLPNFCIRFWTDSFLNLGSVESLGVSPLTLGFCLRLGCCLSGTKTFLLRVAVAVATPVADFLAAIVACVGFGRDGAVLLADVDGVATCFSFEATFLLPTFGAGGAGGTADLALVEGRLSTG